MKELNGTKILDTLIKLYAKQEGVKVTYVIERKGAET
jgi:hypothetical protein